MRTGRSAWPTHLASRRVADNGVLNVRHGIIDEVGIASQQLTNRYALQRRLLSNFQI